MVYKILVIYGKSDIKSFSDRTVIQNVLQPQPAFKVAQHGCEPIP